MDLTQEFRVPTAKIVELLADINEQFFEVYGTFLAPYVETPRVSVEPGW